MATKYIVNNVTGQTISDLTLSGLTVQNITNNNIGYYKALLTQTGSITGTDISYFGYSLIIGETYTIDNYVVGDDFSNIADVQSGTIDETGCVFIATGEYPTNWAEGSNLISDGGLIVNQIENSLGFPIEWSNNGPFPQGIYVGYNSLFGPLNNAFPKKDTYITSQRASSFVSNPAIIVNNFCQVASFIYNNDIIAVGAFDYDYVGTVNDTFYYTPVEITLIRDLSPIEIQCTSIPEFNFSYVSIELYCNGVLIDAYYTNDPTSVNNIAEIVSILNSNENTNIFGTFSEGGTGGIILTMSNYYKNIFCPNGGTLTFTVFAD